MLDYTAYFDNPSAPAMRVVDVGRLFLPTGRVYCCDPFLGHEVRALEVVAKPGDYAVQVCTVAQPDWGRRVALARLVLSPRKVVEWREATYLLDGTHQSEFRVDAGLACFMDAATRDHFVRAVNALHATSEQANYYDDVLAAQFKRNADPENPAHEGDWALHAPVPGDVGNMAIFASGLGDGVYRAHWGFDAAGEPVVLVADFDLLPTPP